MKSIKSIKKFFAWFFVGSMVFAGGVPVVPVDTSSEPWMGYLTTQFNTPDGDLALDEYALDEILEDGTVSWYVRKLDKGSGNFETTWDAKDIEGKKKVDVSCVGCVAYNEFTDDKGKIYREQSTKAEFDTVTKVKDAPSPKRKSKETIIQKLAFIPVARAAVPSIFDSQGASTTAATTVSQTYTISGNANRKLIILCGGADGGAATFNLPTYNAVNATLAVLAEAESSSVNAFADAWYMDDATAPATGSYTLTCSAGTTLDRINNHVVELNDAAQGAPDDVDSNTNTASGSTITAYATSTEAARVISTGAIGDPRTSATPGTGQNTLELSPVAGTGVGNQRTTEETLSSATTDAQVMNWASAGLRRAIAVVTVIGAAAAGGSTPLTDEQWWLLFE